MLAIPDGARAEARHKSLIAPRFASDVAPPARSNGLLLDPERWESPSDVVSLELIERAAIERTVEICDGNISRAATYLGVSPSTIYRKRELKK